jgi:hypothetical protein
MCIYMPYVNYMSYVVKANLLSFPVVNGLNDLFRVFP